MGTQVSTLSEDLLENYDRKTNKLAQLEQNYTTNSQSIEYSSINNKITLLGGLSVGKTVLCKRTAKKDVPKEQTPTLAAEIIPITEEWKEQKYSFTFVDTSGYVKSK
jgi:GTPase SAR1 family protein